MKHTVTSYFTDTLRTKSSEIRKNPSFIGMVGFIKRFTIILRRKKNTVSMTFYCFEAVAQVEVGMTNGQSICSIRADCESFSQSAVYISGQIRQS